MTKVLLIIAIVLSCSMALAHDEKAHQAPQTPKEFEKIKALVGNWEATAVMGGKEDKSNVSYELTAGGSAVMEKTSVGTPHEMLSVYHATGNKVGMTHYCLMGNQPKLTLKKTDDKTMNFEMVGTNGLTSKKEAHMHALTITVNDANHVTEEWTSWENGKKKDTMTINLARK